MFRFIKLVLVLLVMVPLYFCTMGPRAMVEEIREILRDYKDYLF